MSPGPSMLLPPPHPPVPLPQASTHPVEGSLTALFTDPRGGGPRGQGRGGCSGASPPPPGLGARRHHGGCPGAWSLPRGASLAALLPAPADLALGRGPGLLAAVNRKRVGLSVRVSRALAEPLPHCPAGPRPSQLCHPGCCRGEGLARPEAPAHIPGAIQAATHLCPAGPGLGGFVPRRLEC